VTGGVRPDPLLAKRVASNEGAPRTWWGGEGEVVNGQGQVGIVGRIVEQGIAPLGGHIFNLAPETVAFFKGILLAATGAFMVVKLSVRCPEVP
jgi:hypothetical protein